MCNTDILEGEKFWEVVRHETGINLPIHVKKMLKFNGLDHPVAFGGITAQTIDEVETHARDVLKEILDPNEDLQLCYGPYHRKTDKFQFNTRERTMILKLVQLVTDKSLDFWRPKKEKTFAIRQEKVGKMKPLTMSGHENIELERKSLTNKIKNVVNGFCEKENILEQGVVRKVSVNDLSVVVKVDEQYEGENLPQSLSYRAKIQCIFCLSCTELSKVRATLKNSDRRVATNYERHLKSCSKKRKRSVAIDTSQPTSTQLTKRLKEGIQLEKMPTTPKPSGSRCTEPKQVIAELEKCIETVKTLQFPSTELSEVEEKAQVPQMELDQPASSQCPIAGSLEPLTYSTFQLVHESIDESSTQSRAELPISESVNLHVQHSTSISSTLRQSLNIINNCEPGED